MKTMIRTMTALVCLIAVLCLGFAMAEEVQPEVAAAPTPSPEDLGELIIRIEGPEGFEPVEVKYSEFTDGKYTLEGLTPGTYTVTELNQVNLLQKLNYTFVQKESVDRLTVEVTATDLAADPAAVPADAPVANQLKNVYERPEEPEPELPPDTSTLIEIPVTKVWDDFGNRDGNRPDHVIVNLLADGRKQAQTVLSAANGWGYVFKELPKYKGTREIVYTVTEDPVPMYIAEINGYTVTNHYSPETTSATVSKVWNDNNNVTGLRPKSIYCTLSNGTHVLLSEENHWTATVENLPVTVNGRKVTYTWSEQEVLGYKLTSTEIAGNATVFTNSLAEKGNPPEGKNPPTKGKGNPYLIIDDYGTPLGVDVIINHVGDCFD